MKPQQSLYSQDKLLEITVQQSVCINFDRDNRKKEGKDIFQKKKAQIFLFLSFFSHPFLAYRRWTIANPIVAGLSRIPRKQRRRIKKLSVPRGNEDLCSPMLLADLFLSGDLKRFGWRLGTLCLLERKLTAERPCVSSISRQNRSSYVFVFFFFSNFTSCGKFFKLFQKRLQLLYS